MKMLNRHTVLKAEETEGNRRPFITEGLRKAVIRESAFRKKTSESNNPEVTKLYKKQRE